MDCMSVRLVKEFVRASVTQSIPVRLMMEASPAPMAILHAIKTQKLLAKEHPTEETVKMAMPQPAISKQLSPNNSQIIGRYIHNLMH